MDFYRVPKGEMQNVYFSEIDIYSASQQWIVGGLTAVSWSFDQCKLGRILGAKKCRTASGNAETTAGRRGSKSV